MKGKSKRKILIDNQVYKGPNRRSIITGLIAFGVACQMSVAVADESARPFNATFTAAPTGVITVAGDGIATHLGKFDLDVFRLGAGQPSPSDPCVGFQFIVATLTAANGDELWMDYTDGELCFDFANFPVVSFAGEVNFVGTGGTGRFSSSTGNYQMSWSGEITPLGASTSGEIVGVIGY